TILVAFTNVADELAKEGGGDDWGYPHTWTLARALLKHLQAVLLPARFQALIKTLFDSGASTGFLSYLLRAETFAHGFYGERPDPNECLVSHDVFAEIRDSMLRRYDALGIDKVVADRSATTILYAWAQAGGREDVIGRVRTQSQRDDWFIGFLHRLFGPTSSLSLEALSNFFDSPAAVVRRVATLAEKEPPTPGAKAVIDSVKGSIRFDGGDFERVLQSWEQRERESVEEHVTN